MKTYLVMCTTTRIVINETAQVELVKKDRVSATVVSIAQNDQACCCV